ncbi:hypothetical protein ABL78_6764 [Leptomonas seymouri]|uniref:Uncharacterized protein n=1 Tax=Leptomonas seymouri TaxID=5684 RepID=A0A0N1HUX6_LEPSE|nr:hypothetical protein ABL78_6764 [Leptomonas seymouri]|eukprot:KPI84190.1 hypothetical protein ABL78_6764 [Leptomonas seymouri]
MSISPAHWMPIRRPRYSELHLSDDVSSLPFSSLNDPHTQSQRHRSHRHSHSCSSGDSSSSHRRHHSRQPPQQTSHRRYHAQNHAVRKTTSLSSPSRALFDQPEHQNDALHNSHSYIAPALQPRCCRGSSADGGGMVSDSASQSRSGSVPSRLILSVRSSDDPSILHSLHEAHGNNACVHPQLTAHALQPCWSTSKALAELALRGRDAPPYAMEEDGWACGDDERAETSHVPTPPTMPPYTPPRPPPASAMSSVAVPTGSERYQRRAADFQPNSANRTRTIGGVEADNCCRFAHAKTPRPRVVAGIPSPFPVLFPHMERSPHGIQVISSQSPHSTRRGVSQHPQQPTASSLPPPAPAQPQRASSRDANGSRNYSGGSEVGDAAARNRKAGTPSAGPGAVPPGSVGSPNGASVHTPHSAASRSFTLALASAVRTATAEAQRSPLNSRLCAPPPPPVPLLPPQLLLQRGGGGVPCVSVATPDGSSFDALSIPPSCTPCTMTRRAPPRFSIPTDSSNNSTIRDAALKAHPPHFSLPTPQLTSPRRLSWRYRSPRTDCPFPAEESATLSSLPTTPLCVTPLDFTGICDGPLVRNGGVVAGPWWGSGDRAPGTLSPCVIAASYAYSGYDEDDDESEDEFADYRPRWQKEKERQRLEQDAPVPDTCSDRGSRDHWSDGRAEKAVNRDEDYMGPGGRALPARSSTSASLRLDAERSTAAGASRYNDPPRSLRKPLWRPSFWRGSGGIPTDHHLTTGLSSAGWTVSVKRVLSIAGTWLARLLAIYLSSFMLFKTCNKR